jgi:Ca-activated chloride channel family protein
MAFAIAVAAFGQKLRGDTRLGRFDYGDIARLAGPQSDYWRQEFIALTRLAATRAPAGTETSAAE